MLRRLFKFLFRTKKPIRPQAPIPYLDIQRTTLISEDALEILALRQDERFKLLTEQLEISKGEALRDMLKVPLNSPSYSLQVAAAKGFILALDEYERIFGFCREVVDRNKTLPPETAEENERREQIRNRLKQYR